MLEAERDTGFRLDRLTEAFRGREVSDQTCWVRARGNPVQGGAAPGPAPRGQVVGWRRAVIQSMDDWEE